MKALWTALGGRFRAHGGSGRHRDHDAVHRRHRRVRAAVCGKIGRVRWTNLTAAVLAHEEVARYLSGSHGLTGDEARERVITVSSGTADHAAIRAVSRAGIPALSHLAQDRARRRERRAPSSTPPSAAASSTPRITEPHRLPRRTARRGRCRDSPADHRGGHQPVWRAAGPDSQTRHRRTADSTQHQGPGVLITLKAYVGELLRKHDLFFYPEGGRSYSGELKSLKTGLLSAAMQSERAATSSSCPRRSPMTSCSRTTSCRVSERSGGSGRSAASSPRWCALPWAIARRAFVTFGRPIPLDGYDAIVTPVGAGTGAPDARRRSAALQGAADSARRRCHASVDHAARPGGPCRRDTRHLEGGRCECCSEERRGSRRGGSRAVRSARRHRRRSRAVSRTRTPRAAILRAHDRPPAQSPARHTESDRSGRDAQGCLRQDDRPARSGWLRIVPMRRGGSARNARRDDKASSTHSLKSSLQAPRVALWDGTPKRIRPPVHRR